MSISIEKFYKIYDPMVFRKFISLLNDENMAKRQYKIHL